MMAKSNSSSRNTTCPKNGTLPLKAMATVG